jgi:membrane protein DedA with SNARE-associated domain
MAKVKEKKPVQKQHFRFPLTRTNFMIIGFGVLLLVIGYIFMAIPDDPDAFLTRTLSPIILVFAYLIVIPIGLFYREKKEKR